uniref:ATP-dependent DNA helicase n=1 Tax=Brassica oleracea var. oleracea TaxID=109376 RepID=A0A0D3AEX6_BRAOL
MSIVTSDRVSLMNHVKPFKTTWKVEVNVLHSWRQHSNYTGGDSVQFILADKTGVKINDHMLSKLDGEEMIYLSSDSIDPSDTASVNNDALSSDFLNSIKVSGLPNHSLRLKIGCPVMLLRIINPTEGLMNGTRLHITQLKNFMVETRILTGAKVGKIAYIPRFLITPTDKRLPFKMRRRQLSLAVAFAITINKSQGQSLSQVGLFLPRPVFSHEQLYVATQELHRRKV